MINVGAGLKSRRKELNMSIRDTVNALTNYDIKISEKTLYSWESGHRQPDSDVFLILCKIYEIKNILHYFGFQHFRETKKDALSEEEKNMIKKYRELDDRGKDAVLDTLGREHKHVEPKIKDAKT